MAEKNSEISIFGELADFYRASLESDVPTETSFTFGPADPRKKDIDSFADLIERGKITIESFFYLYSLSKGLMMSQIAGKDMDRQSKDDLARDLKRMMIDTIMGSSDQQQETEVDANMLSSLFDLLATEEAFVLQVIEYAFNDAEVTEIRDRLRMRVTDEMAN